MIILVKFIYNCLITFVSPFIYLKLRFGKYIPAYGKEAKQILGFVKYDNKQPLWIHTVSVGESLGAIPLIKSIIQNNPSINIVITTSTATGKALYNNWPSNVTHFYAPLDNPFSVKKFLNEVKPCGLVIMETELWPNWLYYTKRNNIYITLINARLSKRSCNKYKKLGSLFSNLIGNHLDYIICQGQEDYDNFLELGVDHKKLSISGSLKFDVSNKELPKDLINNSFELLESKYVVCFSSTHPTEDELIIKAYAEVKIQIPNIVFIIVPRHPERFQNVYNLINNSGINVQYKTDILNSHIKDNIEIILGNTMGEMNLYFSICDIVVMCGSFAHIGGHNPIEPASLKKPVITGPNYFNFKKIYNEMQLNDGCIICDEQNLVNTIIKLHNNPNYSLHIAENALKIIEKNKGAVNKTEKMINSIYNLRTNTLK